MPDYKEIGVIPYFIRNNSFRFVIVTTRKHTDRWIFPKGQPEDHMTDREAAINEAFEEAGVIGTIQGKAVKIEIKKKNRKITYKLYPFRISKICRRWPERRFRNRRFVKAAKASDILKKPFADALEEFLVKNAGKSSKTRMR